MTPTWEQTAFIPCTICSDFISSDQYRSARCWTDPGGITVAAHQECLARVGEYELRLSNDWGI